MLRRSFERFYRKRLLARRKHLDLEVLQLELGSQSIERFRQRDVVGGRFDEQHALGPGVTRSDQP
jgi:hypothetical protein